MAAKSGGSRSALQPSRTRLGSRPGTFQTLLVPAGFSAESEAAFIEALGLAEPFDGSVHLLHVVEKKAPLALDSRTLTGPDNSLIANRETLVVFAQQDRHPVVPLCSTAPARKEAA
jgi:nucleotide-binding universal stress UspA family protein